MAIARVTTWSSGQSLTASALNGEFDNILNNALALVSPWTGNMNASGYVLQNVSLGAVGGPSIYFTGDSNTGFYSSGADTFDISSGGIRSASFVTLASGVNYVKMTPAITTTGPIVGAAGSDTDISLNLAGQGLNGILLNTNTGTPAANNLYRKSGVQGWAKVDVSVGVPSIAASYNVTSITDTAEGQLNVTWDRDFASTAYASFVAATAPGVSINSYIESFDAASILYSTITTGTGALTDPASWCVVALGAQ